MDCGQASKIMQEGLDGLLDTAGMLRLEEHLAGCARCRSEWHRLQLLDSLFASAQMTPAPPYLRARVIARIEKRERTRRTVLAFTALAFGSITLIIMLIVPVLLNLLSTAGATTALLSGGPATLGQLLNFVKALGRITPLLLDKIASPFAALGLCSMLMAWGLNRLLSGLSQVSKLNNAA